MSILSFENEQNKYQETYFFLKSGCFQADFNVNFQHFDIHGKSLHQNNLALTISNF